MKQKGQQELIRVLWRGSQLSQALKRGEPGGR
jgi:hypothetical protein